MKPTGDDWASFAHDPRDPGVAGIRASDTDRETVRSVLTAAYAEGKLGREEFDERHDALSSVVTLADIPPLVEDLLPGRAVTTGPLLGATPADLRASAEKAYRSTLRQSVLTFVGPSLICWAIWIAITLSSSSAGFPWPLIVMAATFVGLLRTLTTKQDMIADELRRLEKKQAKQMKGRDRQRRRSQFRDRLSGPDAP